MKSPRRHDKSVSPDADVRRRSRPLPSHHDDSGAPTGLRRRSRHYGDNSEAAAVIEQEMENVQALKRLSIGAVSALDPDLPSFNPLYDDAAVASPHSPPRSPDAGSSSGPGINASQASELLWVPAAVHPELAPNQWKEFVQHKVAEIKESVSRSPSPTSPMGPGGGSSVSSDNDGSISPSSSLSRRNSRLSRVISRQEEYMDGSDVLEQQRQRRQSNESLQSIASLSQHLMSLGDLESLAADPFQLRRKLSDSQGKPAAEPLANDSDEPILSTPSSSLRRSTRTRYNKNSLRRPRRGSGRASPLPATESTSTERPADQSLVDSIPVRKLSLSDTPASSPAPASSSPAAAPAPVSAPVSAPISAPVPAPVSAPAPASAPELEPELQSRPADETVPRRPSQGLGVSANRMQPAIEEEVKPLSVPKRPVLHREKSDSQLREKTDSQLQRSQTFDGTESTHQPAPPRRTKTTIEEDVSDALAHTRSSNLANPSKLSESTDVLSSIPLADAAEQPPSRPEPEPESPAAAGSGKRKPSWRWLFNSNSNSNGNTNNQNESPPVGGTIVDKKSIDKLLNRTEDDGDAIGVQEPEKKPAKKSGGFSSLFSKKKSKKDVEQDKPAMTTMATSIQSALDQKRNKSPERHGGQQLHKASRPKSHHARKRSHPKNKVKGQTATSYAMQQHKRRSQQQMERQQAGHQDNADGRSGSAGAGRDVRLPYNIPAHQMSDKSMVMMYHRYPLHIERAIYRLSHLKLANPRRPLAQQVLLSNFMYAYLNLINHGYQQEQQALYEQQLRAKQGDAVSTAEQYAAYGYAADGSAEAGYEYGYEYDYGAAYGGYEAYDEYGVYEQYEDGPYTGAEEGEAPTPAKSPDSTSSSSSSSAGGDDYWTGDDDEQAFTADASSVGEASTVSSKSASGPGPGQGPVSGPSSSSGFGSHIGHRRNFHDSSAYAHAEPVTQP